MLGSVSLCLIFVVVLLSLEVSKWSIILHLETTWWFMLVIIRKANPWPTPPLAQPATKTKGWRGPKGAQQRSALKSQVITRGLQMPINKQLRQKYVEHYCGEGIKVRMNLFYTIWGKWSASWFLGQVFKPTILQNKASKNMENQPKDSPMAYPSRKFQYVHRS